MERKITRTKDGRFCTVEIELEDGRLSICGEEGRVVTSMAACEQAIDYWRSYFEDDPGAIKEMNQRMGTHFRSALTAARYVLRTDGEFHGLDATKMNDGSVRLLESCGQIVETIREWFPEVIPLLPWHLNDMHAGCEHQDALGWGHGKTIALTKDTLTDAQRTTIQADLDRKYEEKIEKLFSARWEAAIGSESGAQKAIKLIKAPGEVVTLYDVDMMLNEWNRRMHGSVAKKVQEAIRAELRKENSPEVFDAAIYKDSLCAPCPECGYRYGTKWLKRELPAEIIELAHNVLKNKEVE